MGFFNQRLGTVRTILAATLLVLFALYIYSAKFYVPSLIKKQIETLETEKGIAFGAGNIYLDLVSGLVLKGVTIGNSHDEKVVEVEKAVIRPEYLRSVKERRLVVGTVRVKNPYIKIGDSLFTLTDKLFSKSEKESEIEEAGASGVDIRHIDVDGLILSLGESVDIGIKKLLIELSGGGEESRTVRLDGNIGSGDYKFSSELRLLRDKKIEIDLKIPELKKGSYSSHFNLPYDAALSLSSGVDYGEGKLSSGIIRISGSGGEELGAIDWDAEYKSETGAANFKSLRGSISGLFDADLKGRAGSLPEDKLSELNGSISVPDLSQLSVWFPVLKRFDLKGSLIADKLNISKSENTVVLNTGFMAKSFETDFGEGDKLTVAEIESTANTDFYITSENNSRRYRVATEGLRASGFSYLNFDAAMSGINNLIFRFDSGEWDLSLDASGPHISNSSLDAELNEFKLNLKVDNKEDVEVNGNVSGEGGKYSTFILISPSSEFKFQPGSLLFTGLDTVIESYGRLMVEKGVLVFPGEANPEYVVEIYSGSYSYFDYPVTSENLTALFVLKPDEGDHVLIEGKVRSEKGSVYGNGFSALSFDFKSFRDEYMVDDVSALFLGGELRGNLGFKSTGNGVSYDIDLDIKAPEYRATSIAFKSSGISFQSKGVFEEGTLGNSGASVSIDGLSIGDDDRDLFKTEFDITADDETISIKEGFISNENGEKFGFNGKVSNYSGNNSIFSFTAPEIPLSFLIELFSDYLPDNTFLIDVEGSVSIDFEADSLDGNYDRWNGKFEISDSTVSAYISDTEVMVENIEGAITIKDRSDIDNKLVELLGTRLAINREIYLNYLRIFQEKARIETRDYIKIGKIKYGFFEADNIECNFEMDKEKMNLLFLKSDIYNGHVYLNGLINFANGKERYNLNMLVSDLSLENISNSLPSMKGYITGVVDGLLWFTVGDSYTTINGPFAFWAKDSRNEKRTIGRALLDKIGAKGRFFTGSSRRYDHGEISGYIKDGLITFKNFVISNKILGYTDLKIEADKKMNSISVKHLLSVIRELARRASKGDIEIEYQ